MLCGGIKSVHVTQFATGYAALHTDEINSLFSVHNQSYKIKEQGTQVVNGVDHFLHLIGSDQKEYSITLLEHPLPNHGGTIIEAGLGHH